MLIADNRAYKYENEEYAYDIPFYHEELEVSEKRVKKRESGYKSKSHIFSVIFVFTICIIIIAHYAYIAEINFNINMLERELKELKKANSSLNVELARTINLQSLETIAFEDLNMQYPSADQIVYINVEKTKVNNNIKNGAYLFKEDVIENKYITKVKSAISLVLSLLD